MFHGGWRDYVPVAKRREKAAKKVAALEKQGRRVAPIRIEGRTIARTFWGKAWCDNLERYSDYSNRLPRGRTYVRNGSVIDLQVAAGKVSALVQGSELYEVEIGVGAVSPARWAALRRDCAGEIGSLVELLQGRFAKGVMERICARETGLFPAPSEIRLSCSCPDWAEMCKHVAAVLYGVGARLDERPELLFLLRGVDGAELIPTRVDLPTAAAPAERVLADEALGELFGIELGDVPPPAAFGEKTNRAVSPVEVADGRPGRPARPVERRGKLGPNAAKGARPAKAAAGKRGAGRMPARREEPARRIAAATEATPGSVTSLAPKTGPRPAGRLGDALRDAVRRAVREALGSTAGGRARAVKARAAARPANGIARTKRPL